MHQKIFSNDDLFLLRRHIFNFVNLKLNIVNGDILEVGPIGALDSNAPFQEFNYTKLIKEYSIKNNFNYKTLDILDGCDYKLDILDLNKLNNKFDTILLMSVIEHIPEFWKLPEVLFNSLNDNGKVLINSPFMFKVHGPLPDCWRISTYGYEALFSKLFNIDFDVYPNDQVGKNSIPLSICAVLTKK